MAETSQDTNTRFAKGAELLQKLDDATATQADPGRWVLLRDLAVFQGKLVLDALRDFALSPISLVAAIVGIIRKPERPGQYFYSLMGAGRQSDYWINLFGAARHAGVEFEAPEKPSVDNWVAKLEDVVVRQYEAGGLTKDAKEAIDKSIDKVAEHLRQEGRSPFHRTDEDNQNET